MASDKEDEVVAMKMASVLQADPIPQQKATDVDSLGHSETQEEQTQDPDSISRSSASSASSFSHKLEESNQGSDEESNQESDEDSFDFDSDADTEKMFKRFTALRPEFPQPYGTPEYFSALVKEHILGVKQPKSEGKRLAAEMFSVISISVDHYAWEVRQELRDMKNKETTDHEQLCRLRSLLLAPGPLYGETAFKTLGEIFRRQSRASPPGSEYQALSGTSEVVIEETPSRRRRRRRRSHSRVHGFLAQNVNVGVENDNESTNGWEEVEPVFRDPSISARPPRRHVYEFWQLLRVMRTYGIKGAKVVCGVFLGIIGLVLFSFGMVIQQYVEGIREVILPFLSRWRRG